MSVEMLSSFPKELTAEVDTVVFDVVGTLLEPSPSVAKAYKNSADRKPCHHKHRLCL